MLVNGNLIEIHGGAAALEVSDTHKHSPIDE
jgi:hypothetical protein